MSLLSSEINAAAKRAEVEIARLQARADLIKQKSKSKKAAEFGSNFLMAAIESCLESEPKIEEEKNRLREAIDEIARESSGDPNNLIRKEYLEWQLDTLTIQAPKIIREAKRRKRLLEYVDATASYELEMEKCKADTKYWFENYAWTADPRNPLFWAIPFNLYKYQADSIDEFEKWIFRRRSSGGVEKSRDLGLTWLFMALFAKHFLMPQNNTSFHALVGSITADEVDKIGDPSTMFEKLRLIFRLLPDWMLPDNWDGKIGYMKAVNPKNGSTITGETANADFGRSGRYTVILFDEFSAFALDTAAMTASSQSSPCKIYNSTARGMNNEFYKLRAGTKIPFLRLHWELHPYKDERWYRGQSLEMSDEMIAQELDIDYNASQPNKVYPMWNELYHVVTETEMLAALPALNHGGRLIIPDSWAKTAGEDVGQSIDHAHVSLWFATAPEGTKTEAIKDESGQILVPPIDVSGSVFLYREHVFPPATAPKEVVETFKSYMDDWGEKQENIHFLISQEADTEILVMAEYGLSVSKWTANYVDGIPRVTDYLKIRNPDKPHPFRAQSHRIIQIQNPDAPEIKGYGKFFVIVPDEEGELGYVPDARIYTVKPALTNAGKARFRMEIPVYHYPKGEQGKPVTHKRPAKKLDDAMDVFRCVAYKRFPPVMPLNTQQRREESLPKSLRSETITEDTTPEHKERVFLARQAYYNEFDKKEDIRKAGTFRERIYAKYRK